MQQASSAQAVLVPGHQTSNHIRIVCGGSSIKGRRPQQEDVLLIHTDTPAHPSSFQVLFACAAAAVTVVAAKMAFALARRMLLSRVEQ